MLRLGIDPEKLYRATFICQDGLCCCHMALISFRLFRKNLGNFRYVLGKWFTAPPWQKISPTPMFLLSSLLHHQYISIVFPPPSVHFHCLPSSITAFLLSSLLDHHYISIVFPPPSLHIHCLPSSTTSTFLLSSLLLHHCISTVFPPPPPLHFYCLPSSTTTAFLLSFALHHYPFAPPLFGNIIARLPPPLMGIWSSVNFAKYTVGSETRSRFFQLVGSCLTF